MGWFSGGLNQSPLGVECSNPPPTLPSESLGPLDSCEAEPALQW